MHLFCDQSTFLFVCTFVKYNVLKSLLPKNGVLNTLNVFHDEIVDCKAIF